MVLGFSHNGRPCVLSGVSGLDSGIAISIHRVAHPLCGRAGQEGWQARRWDHSCEVPITEARVARPPSLPSRRRHVPTTGNGTIGGNPGKDVTVLEERWLLDCIAVCHAEPPNVMVWFPKPADCCSAPHGTAKRPRTTQTASEST